MARKRKQSRKQRAASLRNLAKARSKRRAHKRAGRKHNVRGHYRRKKGGGRTRVRRHRSYEEAAKPRRRRRRRRHAARAAEAPRRRRRRRRHAAAAEAPKRRRSKRRKAPRRRRARRYHGYRVGSRGIRSHRPRRGRKRRHHKGGTVRMAAAPRRRHRRGRRRGAMENPLGMGEVIVGGLSGLAGYASAELLDRFLATHALTDTGNKDANGNAMYSDPGDANGHWNSTNILAPMDIKRWAAGAALSLIPIFGAKYAPGGPKMKAFLGFYGFGALIRTVGKGATDGIAYLTRKMGTGQRLFVLEDSAQAATLASYDANPPGVAPGPTGLRGLPNGVGACGNCANCKSGVGACCRGGSTNTLPPAQPPGVSTTAPNSPPTLQDNQPPPPPPPPAATAPSSPTMPNPNAHPALGGVRAFPPPPHMPQSGHQGFVRAVRGVGGVPNRSVFNWGSDD